MAKGNQKIYFVDTNIFLRILVKEDEKSFRDCFRFLESVQDKKIHAQTSDLVLAEISWVLGSYYKFSKNKIAPALEGIVNLKGLVIKNSSNAPLAIELYRKNKVKFVDALIASGAIDNPNAIIVSYDRDFDKLKVTRKPPGETK